MVVTVYAAFDSLDHCSVWGIAGGIPQGNAFGPLLYVAIYASMTCKGGMAVYFRLLMIHVDLFWRYTWCCGSSFI